MSSNVFNLTEENIAVLKHLLTINRSIIFRKNTSEIQILDEQGKKAARLNFLIPPKTFGIYNLQSFLSTLNALETGDVLLEDDYILIQGKYNNRAKIHYSDIETIKCCPEREIPFANIEATFTVPNEAIAKFQGMGKILNCNQLKFFTEDDKIFGKVLRLGSTTGGKESDTYTAEIEDANGQSFDNYLFDLGYLNFLSGIYKVEISDRKNARFTSPDIVYYVAGTTEKDY